MMFPTYVNSAARDAMLGDMGLGAKARDAYFGDGQAPIPFISIRIMIGILLLAASQLRWRA
jgi:hypothetical protein